MHVSNSGNELIYFYILCMQFIVFKKELVLCYLSLSVLYRASGSGTAYPSGAPEFTPGF